MFNRYAKAAFTLVLLTFLSVVSIGTPTLRDPIPISLSTSGVVSAAYAYPMDNVFVRITDANGKSVSGGKVYVFTAGTTTPVTTHSCYLMSGCANAHPVVADSGGKIAAMYIPAGSYKIRYTNSAGTILYEVDNYVVADIDNLNDNNYPVFSKTADYTVTETDDGAVLSVDASAAPGTLITITAEAQGLGNGFPFCVVNAGATGSVIVTPDAGETINGSSSYSIASQYQTVCFISRGAAGWFVSSGSGVTTIPLTDPGGRLTYTTAVPVMTSDVTAGTTVYYTPYKNGYIMLYDGVSWTPTAFSEVSQTLADATKSPLAAAVSSAYDVFGWLDGTTFRATRGPAWTSVTVRGTGAGTTELERVNGVWMNKFSITNGPASHRGVYLGSFETNASTQVVWTANPAAAAGGTDNQLSLWNMYNRVIVFAVCRDSTNTWTYATDTFQSANASNSNRITVFTGQIEEAVDVTATSTANVAATFSMRTGIGVDSITVGSGFMPYDVRSTGLYATQVAKYQGLPALGQQFFQKLEAGTGTGLLWYGDNGLTTLQSGISLMARM